MLFCFWLKIFWFALMFHKGLKAQLVIHHLPSSQWGHFGFLKQHSRSLWTMDCDSFWSTPTFCNAHFWAWNWPGTPLRYRSLSFWFSAVHHIWNEKKINQVKKMFSLKRHCHHYKYSLKIQKEACSRCSKEIQDNAMGGREKWSSVQRRHWT